MCQTHGKADQLHERFKTSDISRSDYADIPFPTSVSFRHIECFLVLATLGRLRYVGKEDEKLDELAKIYTNTVQVSQILSGRTLFML